MVIIIVFAITITIIILNITIIIDKTSATIRVTTPIVSLIIIAFIVFYLHNVTIRKKASKLYSAY